MVTVATGCLVMVVIMYHAWLMFALPLGGGVEGFRLKLVLWVALTILLVPVAFYVGMVAMYGAFGLVMFVLGILTGRQSADPAWRARYSKAWYKPNA